MGRDTVRRRFAGHPHGWLRPAALAAAVVTAAAMLWLDPPAAAPPRPATRPATAPEPVTPLGRAWPAARVRVAGATLADGAAYTPWSYLDADLSVGTAPTPDGAAVRLLLVRHAGATSAGAAGAGAASGGAVSGGAASPGAVSAGAVRELRRVGAADNPQFIAFASAGDQAFWVDYSSTGAAEQRTRLWRLDLGTGRTALLTEDMGDIVAFNSQHDLAVVGGRVYWISAAAAATSADLPTTELRSVPVAGGPVRTRRIEGPFTLTAWPWLISAGLSEVSTTLLNLDSGARIAVPQAAGEQLTCSPAWCRAVVQAASGVPVRVDVMRPDGSDRRRVAGAAAIVPVYDVALLDRFDVVTLPRDDATAAGTRDGPAGPRLMLYDLTGRRLVQVAAESGTVMARGAVLWWSSGTGPAMTWHSLDLRELT